MIPHSSIGSPSRPVPHPMLPHHLALAWSLWVLLASFGGSAILADGIRINEFLAINANSLTDEDDDTSDWIELVSEESVAIDLDGWFLTDDPGLLGKWRMPSRTLAPGAYLVIFASGKDRAPLAGELHANFRLDGDGDFLALVRPDGSIEHAFSPRYPPQREDVSYGEGEEVLSQLVGGRPSSQRTGASQR